MELFRAMALAQHPPAPLPAPDRTLVKRLAAGDRSALRELRIRYGTTAYAVAYSVVVDPEDAEGVVSEAFARALGEAGEYTANGEGVAAWISRLTREAAERFRRSA
jgi:RNA polymerase sigma-70 factor (ECF subfamily)